MNMQYETVSEICGNLTEIIKLHLFKENGKKESLMLALREKTTSFHENVSIQTEVDEYQPSIKYRGMSFK